MKPGDLSADIKFYNFLIKSDSVMTQQQWNFLDAPDVLCSLITKLPRNTKEG